MGVAGRRAVFSAAQTTSGTLLFTHDRLPGILRALEGLKTQYRQCISYHTKQARYWGVGGVWL